MSVKIPKKFHFIFGLKPRRQEFHLIHYLCLESCFQVNQPEIVYFYSYREPFGRYWDLIKDKLTRVQVDLVPQVSAFAYTDKLIRKNYTYAHHSDFIRIEQLNRHGGVYADIDTLFVNPFPPGLYEKPFVMGEEPPVPSGPDGKVKPSVCNALIMARKDSAFGKLYYDAMAGALDGSWSNHSCSLAWELSRKHPDEIHLEPSVSFYKHTWTREGINTLLLGCDRDFSGVYSLHLWAHLWWSRWRRDFTSFHAGRMTESFVRSVDTTYNIAARKFLPKPEARRFFNCIFAR